MFKFLSFFSKYQADLELAHQILDVIIAHTKRHNTLTAIDTGIVAVSGLSVDPGATATPSAPPAGPTVARPLP